ncbi:MAG: DUF6089 family protein [Flavobacteriales bacterium]
MRYCIAFLGLMLITASSQAQSYSAWKRLRAEMTFGGGTTNFLGDLGGADQIGTDYYKDFEMNMTRPTAFVGGRYKLNPRHALMVGFQWGMLAGDDRTTAWPDRMNRQFQFRSHVLELGARYEFYFVKEKSGHIYKLKKIKGMKSLGLYPYIFVGVAGFYHNPKGKDANGNWHSIRPLNTEGQGIIATRKPFSPIGLAIPYGIGFRRALDKRWMIGIDYGQRKTFTDYMDGVSTTYFDNATILAFKGAPAAYLADPNLGTNQYYVAGQQRGDPTDKDSYGFFTVTVSYKLKTGRDGRVRF